MILLLQAFYSERDLHSALSTSEGNGASKKKKIPGERWEGTVQVVNSPQAAGEMSERPVPTSGPPLDPMNLLPPRCSPIDLILY